MMVDPGSMQNWIRKDLADSLRLKYGPLKEFLVILADNSTKMMRAPEVDFFVQNLETRERFLISKALVVNELPDIGNNYPAASNLEMHPHLLDLAPNFPVIEDCKLQILIGGSDPSLITPTEVRKSRVGSPWAAKLPTGWVIYGRDDSFLETTPTCTASCSAVISGPSTFSCPPDSFKEITNEILDGKLERLLEVEFPESRHDDTRGLSVNDKKVIRHYEKTLSRVGKNYSVGLPFKTDDPNLPNNYALAFRVLESTEKFFKKHPEHQETYTKHIRSLFDDQHAVVLREEEIQAAIGKIFYIPHQLVFTSGKPRVVFNCSSKYKNVSLNCLLMKGPFLGSSLLKVLLRLREFPYSIVGDLQKMYYKIFVPTEDQDFLRFLWWKDDKPGGKIIHCRMTRLAFGLLSAQSGAQFCLYSAISANEAGVSQETVDALANGFYVDDLGHSERTSEDLVRFYLESVRLLSAVGHKLTKISTSCKALYDVVPPDDVAKECQLFSNFCEGEESSGFEKKTLGLMTSFSYQSNFCEGHFSFSISLPFGTPSRRFILHSYGGIYDPIGFIMPLLVYPKKLLRDLCKQKLDWDD